MTTDRTPNGETSTNSSETGSHARRAGRLEHEPTLEAIRERLARSLSHSYLRDWVYGGIGGAVTTFAVVSGVTGAELGARVILILGAANLIADGFSMAASNYAGTTSERQQLEQAAAIERRHIEQEPEGERTEVREIFRRKGLEGDDWRPSSDESPRTLVCGFGPWLPRSTAFPRRFGRRGSPRSVPFQRSCSAAPSRSCRKTSHGGVPDHRVPDRRGVAVDAGPVAVIATPIR